MKIVTQMYFYWIYINIWGIHGHFVRQIKLEQAGIHPSEVCLSEEQVNGVVDLHFIFHWILKFVVYPSPENHENWYPINNYTFNSMYCSEQP